MSVWGRPSAIALTANRSVLMAISNDWRYDQLIRPPLQVLVTERDLLIGIGTTVYGHGNSPNLLHAVEEARGIGAGTVGLLGIGGGRLADIVALTLVVLCDSTPRIHEVHMSIGPVVCGLAEQSIVKLSPDTA